MSSAGGRTFCRPSTRIASAVSAIGIAAIVVSSEAVGITSPTDRLLIGAVMGTIGFVTCRRADSRASVLEPRNGDLLWQAMAVGVAFLVWPVLRGA